MVACLLLGMLVSALTMVFNQSSIAWRSGTAGVTNLNKSRSEIGKMHDFADEMLPGLASHEDMNYRVASMWKDGNLRSDRGYESATPPFSYADAKVGRIITVASAGQGQSSGLFIVGVRSAGPDRAWDTEDDITTWPEGVQ